MTTAPGDPLGCVHLGVHRIGGHHRLVQVQRFEKLSERGDLVGLAGHPLLGQHGAGGVVQSGQEMGHRHLPPTSPAHGLAIHRDHSASVDGAGAYAHHDLRWASTSAGSRSCSTRRMDDCRGQGLVRRWSQGLQVGGGQVGGVLPYRRQAATAREHSGHSQRQDRRQVMAHTPSVAWVGDAPEDTGRGLARQGGRDGR